MQACKNLKNGKSCGMDGILNEPDFCMYLQINVFNLKI
jgi:hypothetical protein